MLEESNPIPIILIADGDPSSSATNSGVARHLLLALQRNAQFSVVGTASSMPSKIQRVLIRVLTIRLPRSRWANESRKGRFATRVRTRNRDAHLRYIDRPEAIVLQVRNTYYPSKQRYIPFIDGTAIQSQQGWAQWKLGERSFNYRVLVEKVQFQNAFAVFTAGEHTAEHIRRRYTHQGAAVFAVGGGTNIDRPNRPTIRSKSTTIDILFVGVDFERKGGRVLLQAFHLASRDVPNLRLHIVGCLDDQAQEAPNVLCHGFISDRSRLNGLYEKADIFCLPSLFEPYGLAVQEAFAHTLPCIVSDQGALADLVGSDCGRVVPAGSVEDLRSAIVDLALDHEARIKLGTAAWKKLSGMTWDNVVERMRTAIHVACVKSQND